MPLLKDEATSPHRDHVLIGKERHDIGRPGDGGYPIRGIVKDDFLYIQNFEPDRWPSGNPETGYLNCDGSPTKSVCLNARTSQGMKHYWQLNFGKRGAEELYNIAEDPECLANLAADDTYTDVKEELSTLMVQELNGSKRSSHPRRGGCL